MTELSGERSDLDSGVQEVSGSNPLSSIDDRSSGFAHCLSGCDPGGSLDQGVCWLAGPIDYRLWLRHF